MASTDRIDGFTASEAIKAPVRAATTTNITLSGEQTIDGVAIVAEDRVLVKDQTTASENGIYIAKTGAWVRAKDFDGARDTVEGTIVFCINGTVNTVSLFRVSTSGTITIGTTSLSFTKINGAFTGTFQSSLSGSVEVSIQQKLDEIVSVADFGAVGDGVTDDTDAIQAAINSGAKHIIIPDTGSPYLFTTLTLSSASGDNRTALILEGQNYSESGSVGSYLKCTSTTATAIDIQDGNCVLRHIRLDADTARQASGTACKGIHLRGDLTAATIVRVILEDVWVMRQPGDGIVVEGAELCRFINCHSNSNGGIGWNIKTAGSGSTGISNTFDTCRSYNNDLGGWYCSSWFNTFINCQSLANNQSSTLYAGSSYEVDLQAQNNVLINMDVEAQAQHSGTAGVDRPTAMHGIRVAGKDCSIISGIVAGFDTGVLVTGSRCYIQNTNFNNSSSGGDMTYAVDNSAVNDLRGFIADASSPDSVTTTLRNKTCYLVESDGQVYCGGINMTAAAEELSGPGAISTSVPVTEITTTGSDAYTLASPAYDGKLKLITMVGDGGTGTLTPTNLANGSTITFDDVGDCAFLVHMAGSWHFLGGTATLA